MSPIYAADLEAIRSAEKRIEGHAHRTPVFSSSAINAMSGRHLFFKCEQFQRVGAFKFRGAMNAITKRMTEDPPSAFVTHSSGNHAQAVALAAKLHGVPAHIVMPTNAPDIKRRAVLGYGATVHPCAPVLSERERVAQWACRETGGVLIPPYDHPDVIAGQGTVGSELFEQVKDLDAVICPVGGGGLLSGVTLAFRALSPRTAVFGAEPEGADDAARSKAENRLIPQTDPRTIADGLRTSLGEYTWPVVRDLVDEILVVNDHEIVGAMRTIWERMKLLIEPSAAVGLAALLSGRFDDQGRYQRIGIVLTGGNVDLEALPW
jgi:threonine dehydratase